MLRRPCRTGFGEGHRRPQFTRRDPRKCLRALRGVGDPQKQIRGENRGRQVRRAQQCAPHLFGNDGQFRGSGVRPAELLRDDQAQQTQRRQLGPYRGVVPAVGGHQPAYLVLR